jgi:hypothetical protein
VGGGGEFFSVFMLYKYLHIFGLTIFFQIVENLARRADSKAFMCAQC